MKSIKEMRKELGWSQEQFAKKTGIPRQTIVDWESGKSTPYIREMLKVYTAYLKNYELQETRKIKLKRMFAENGFTTLSDMGSVRVFGNDFDILIPNGEGDGTTYCATFEKDCFDIDFMIFSGFMLDGKMSVSDYDCEKNACCELEGKYWVYTYMGFVAFVKVY